MIRKLFSIVLLLSATFFSYAQLSSSLQKDDKDNFSLYLMGVQSELLGNYPAAQSFYDMSVSRSDSSTYIPSLLSAINLHLMSNDYSQITENLLKQAYKAGVNEDNLNMMMVNFKLGKKDFGAAEALCNKILQKDSTNRKILSLLPYIDYSNNKKSESLSRINFYEQHFGFEPTLYSIKRQILSENNLYDSLLSYNRRLVELYPENPQLYGDLADVYAAVGQDSMASAIWVEIENDDPDNISLIASRNYFYSTHGMKDKAIETSAQLLASPLVSYEGKQQVFRQIFMTVDIQHDKSLLPLLDSALWRSWRQECDTCVLLRESVLGYFYFRKDVTKCLELLDSLESSSPGSGKYTLQKASFFNEYGNLERAIEIIDSGMVRFPGNSDFVIFKSELLKNSGKTKESLKLISSSIKSAKSDSVKSVYYSYLADTYYKDGNKSKAFKLYDSALAANADNSLALNNYAYFLALSNKDLERALGMSHKCNLLNDMNATYLDTEAYILFLLGRFQEAKDLMDKAFSSISTNPSDEMLLHYADILASLNNKILAKEYYKRALSAGADKTIIEEKLKALNN